jgi:hypothetical protein
MMCRLQPKQSKSPCSDLYPDCIPIMPLSQIDEFPVPSISALHPVSVLQYRGCDPYEGYTFCPLNLNSVLNLLPMSYHFLLLCTLIWDFCRPYILSFCLLQSKTPAGPICYLLCTSIRHPCRPYMLPFVYFNLRPLQALYAILLCSSIWDPCRPYMLSFCVLQSETLAVPICYPFVYFNLTPLQALYDILYYP